MADKDVKNVVDNDNMTELMQALRRIAYQQHIHSYQI